MDEIAQGQIGSNQIIQDQRLSMQIISDEIERCQKLYPEFEQNWSILKLLYQVKHRFGKDSGRPVKELRRPCTQEQADASFKKGRVLLPGEKLNKEVLLQFVNVIFNTMTDCIPTLKTPLEHLRTYIDTYLHDYADVVEASAIYKLSNHSFEEIQIKKDFATYIFFFLLSSLYQWQLDDSLKGINTKHWMQSNCPVCGQKPHYGMLREEDGAKVMECWQCRTPWIYPRLKCPFCETVDHHQLGYFTAGSNELCRVYFCNKCLKYYKVFNFRDREFNHAILSLHHLATLPCDILAVKEGFEPGSGLCWVNDEDYKGSTAGGDVIQ